MTPGLTNQRIAGVAIFIFFSILLGVGIHHLVATGTCSSTGYSANLGPVPRCPSGTGWWILFVMGGIFGGLIGAGMAGSLSLIFAGIFGAIGIGALTLLFDSKASTGEHVFAGIFGGAFTLVGIVAAGFMVASLRWDRGDRTKATATASPAPAAPASDDPIMSSYLAGKSGTASIAGLSDGSSLSGAGLGAPAGLGAQTGLAGPADSTLTRPSQAAPSPTKTAELSVIADQLTKLAELRRSGALSEAEFEAAKTRLIGGS